MPKITGSFMPKSDSVSAQGGSYDEDGKPPKDEAQQMRVMDVPSERISVVSKDGRSHDLTEPIYWLLA